MDNTQDNSSALNDSETQGIPGSDAARILESITDAFFALDLEWRFTSINAQAERLLFRSRAELLGKCIWDEFPDAIGTAFELEYRRAMDEQAAVSYEQYYPPLSAWFDVRAYPSKQGLSVFFQDVTARKRAEDERDQRIRRERFLAELAERARRLTDPEEVIADAVSSVGLFLGVSRCVFADIDIDADMCTIPCDYCAHEAIVSIAGSFPISDFGPFVVAEYLAGRSVAIDDIHNEPIRVPAAYLAAYEGIACQAYIAAPVLHSSRLVSVIAVHNATPRHWEPEEVALLQTVVERTWLTVEVTRQNRALVRSAEERRETHERTGRILESIVDAFFALDTEWRFTYVNRQAEVIWGRSREALIGKNVWLEFPQAVGSTFDTQFRRAVFLGEAVTFEEFYPPLDAWLDVRAYPSSDGLSVFFQNVNARKKVEDEREQLANANRLLLDSTGDGIYGIDIEGRFTFVNRAAARMLGYAQEQMVGLSGHALIHHTRPDGAPFPEDECPIYRAIRSGESVHIDDEVFWRADGTSFPVAYSAAPILEQAAARGAVVTFSDISERKAMDEEREQLVQREHRIADQLQAALQPPLPPGVAGLKLAKYYEAALEEAGVGGDFFDCFPIEKGCTALVVGDLSGKGLAAAAQVSTVRNMLRAFLYSRPTLAEAVTDLNRVLAINNLLTGFATLWVGCYDDRTRLLSYVNLGQEPALIRRAATGAVEQLVPTGPVLGAMENASYEERTVTLFPGDALAVFTDGVTECGMSRQEMLGIDGAAALLKPPFLPEETESAERMAEAVMLRLVEGVDAASRGGVAKDDICVLVAAAEGGSAEQRFGLRNADT